MSDLTCFDEENRHRFILDFYNLLGSFYLKFISVTNHNVMKKKHYYFLTQNKKELIECSLKQRFEKNWFE